MQLHAWAPLKKVHTFSVLLHKLPCSLNFLNLKIFPHIWCNNFCVKSTLWHISHATLNSFFHYHISQLTVHSTSVSITSHFYCSHVFHMTKSEYLNSHRVQCTLLWGYVALAKTHILRHYEVMQQFLHFVIVALISENPINR